MGSQPSTITSLHWQMETLALVNWGAYDGGPHTIRFATSDGGTLTLISGLSATGKSTALDALIVLLMSARVPLNRASSSGEKDGRRRDLYTYSRGYLDTQSVDGAERAAYLRGTDPETGAPQATWSYIGLTLVNAFGEPLTVALLT